MPTKITFPAAGDALMAHQLTDPGLNCPHCGLRSPVGRDPLGFAGLYLGLQEGRHQANHPLVLAMLRLDNPWVEGDDTAWCSAFVNWVAFHLGLPRSRKLSARSWLDVGRRVDPYHAQPGDVIVLTRGPEPQPSAEVRDAPGHVGFFVKWDQDPPDRRTFTLRGGNQGDGVCDVSFPMRRVLDIRRLT